MNAQELIEKIMEVINDDAAQEILPVDSMRTFADAGLMTQNKGIVLTFPDGSEFQISVIKSR